MRDEGWVGEANVLVSPGLVVYTNRYPPIPADTGKRSLRCRNKPHPIWSRNATLLCREDGKGVGQPNL